MVQLVNKCEKRACVMVMSRTSERLEFSKVGKVELFKICMLREVRVLNSLVPLWLVSELPHDT